MDDNITFSINSCYFCMMRIHSYFVHKIWATFHPNSFLAWLQAEDVAQSKESLNKMSFINVFYRKYLFCVSKCSVRISLVQWPGNTSSSCSIYIYIILSNNHQLPFLVSCLLCNTACLLTTHIHGGVIALHNKC